MAIFTEITEKDCIRDRYPHSTGKMNEWTSEWFIAYRSSMLDCT